MVKQQLPVFFKEEGIPVYIADDEAKKVMQSSEIINQIKTSFGESLFDNNVLNRSKLAEIVFNNKEELEKLNAIVHPAVKKRFSILAFTK
ncbi:hypothetical protein AAFH68_12170 [Flavobacterium sp. CGRL1]